MRFLGIDYGTKKIGLSISDERGEMAFAHEVYENNAKFRDKLKAVIEERGVEEVVIGKSLDFNQKENPIMKAVHELKEHIEEELKIPAHLQAEFLTSVEARRIQGPHSRIDASAAALILQSYLDKRNDNKES